MLPTIIFFLALFITIFLLSKIALKLFIYLYDDNNLNITLEVYLFILPCSLWSYLFYLLH